MTDKPQTLAEQILATYPPLMSPDQRVAWDGAISRAAALADAATPTGWVIANGNDDRWRCVWEWESNAEWTDDITQALKFATRDDAERYSKEDEDAWLIYQVGIPPTTTPVVVAEQASDVRQAARAAARITAALEPDPTPALGWRAMQTAAAEAVAKEAHGETVLGGQRFKTVKLEDAVEAILAMTGPTDAQLRAEAVKLEAVQVVMARVEHMCAWADQTEAQRLLIGPGYSTAEARKEVAAIAKIGGDA